MQQGNSNQKETLKKFREDTNSVLLGTGSYWEGINIEGASLSQVIIFKLPFPIREPIIDYKYSKSRNGLMEVAVPEMIIKLKQGIGRLIRSEEDKGIICLRTMLDFQKIQHSGIRTLGLTIIRSLLLRSSMEREKLTTAQTRCQKYLSN